MSSGAITITPGKQFATTAGGERIDLAKLNQLGQPSARVDEGAITRRELQNVILDQIDDATASISTILSTYATDSEVAAAISTEVAARNGAISAAVSTEASARATADGYLSGKYTLKVTAGDVVTGFNITSSSGAGTDTSSVTFQAGVFKIYNGTSGVAPFTVTSGIVYMQNAVVDGALIAGTIGAGTVFAGSLSAVTGTFGAVTIGGALTMNSTGHIKGGQTAYNTGTGFFLGYDTSTYKFSIGTPAGNRLLWDGTYVSIYGGSGSDQVVVDSGGFTVGTPGARRVTVGTYSGNPASQNFFDSGGTSLMGLYLTGTTAASIAQAVGSYGSILSASTTNSRLQIYGPSSNTVTLDTNASGYAQLAMTGAAGINVSLTDNSTNYTKLGAASLQMIAVGLTGFTLTNYSGAVAGFSGGIRCVGNVDLNGGSLYANGCNVNAISCTTINGTGVTCTSVNNSGTSTLNGTVDTGTNATIQLGNFRIGCGRSPTAGAFVGYLNLTASDGTVLNVPFYAA